MRLILIVAALLLGTVAPALAFDTPKALLEALYAPYSKGDTFDWDSWDEAQFRSAELNALFARDIAEADGGIGRLDFDPYIDGQDYQLTKLAIGEAEIDGDTASVEVTLSNFGRDIDLTYALVHEADGWKVDDVVSHDANLPYSLKALLAPLE